MIEIDGISYLLGSAGSLILACPNCGEEHFRNVSDVCRMARISNHNNATNIGIYAYKEKCFSCGTVMEPIKIDELKTRWEPFWISLGWELNDQLDSTPPSPEVDQ